MTLGEGKRRALFGGDESLRASFLHRVTAVPVRIDSEREDRGEEKKKRRRPA